MGAHQLLTLTPSPVVEAIFFVPLCERPEKEISGSWCGSWTNFLHHSTLQHHELFKSINKQLNSFGYISSFKLCKKKKKTIVAVAFSGFPNKK